MLVIQYNVARSNSVYVNISDAIQDFNFLSKNADGTEFFASLPVLTGTLRISLLDLYPKLKLAGKGDTFIAEYYKDGINIGLKMKLYVIEATYYQMTNDVEIGFSGNFLAQASSLFGTIQLNPAPVADTLQKYGLEEYVYSSDEKHGETTINVLKKEDLILGIAWSYKDRRNIALLPFTTFDKAFMYKQDGLAIFKDSNDYEIRNEDIVDYYINPADPPVTHLRTTTLGDYGVMPFIPTISFNKASSVPIAERVQFFEVEEASLYAVSTINEDNTGRPIYQTLTWSDGYSCGWELTDHKPRNIIGIFIDTFVEIPEREPGDAMGKIYIRDKVTNRILQMFDIQNESEIIAAISSTNKPVVTTYIEDTTPFGNEFTAQVLWLPAIADLGNDTYAPAISYRYDDIFGGERYVYEVSQTSVYDNKGKFLAVNKVSKYNDYERDYYNVYDAVYLTSDDAVNVGVIVFELDPTYDELDFGTYTGMKTFCVSGKTQRYNMWEFGHGPETALDGYEPLDAYVFEPEGAAGAVLIQLSVRHTGVQALKKKVVEFTFRGGSIPSGGRPTNVVMDFLNEYIQYSLMRYAVNYETTVLDYAQMNVVALTSTGTWDLLGKQGDAYSNVIQTGRVDDWLKVKYNDIYLRHYRDISLFVLDRSDEKSNYFEAILQYGIVPFISRQPGQLGILHKITDGETNIKDLPFKVGAITQVSVQNNREVGRLELEISRFYYKDKKVAEFTEASTVQALNIIPMGAEVKVYLTEDRTQPLRIKVIGTSISYQGRLIEKVYGLVMK